MKKIYKEIKLIGLFNWIWFVLYLKRNEFSVRLNMSTKEAFDRDNWYKVVAKRNLACELKYKLRRM